ncbi:MAG: methyl-accepting chemotaxis protein [Pseudomonadota bacterium]
MATNTLAGRIQRLGKVNSLLLVLVAAVGSGAAFKLTSLFGEFQTVTDESLIIQDMLENTFQVRLAASQLQAQDNGVGAELERRIAEINASSTELAELAKDAALLATLKKLDADVATYKDALKQMGALQATLGLGVAEVRGLADRVAKEMHDLEVGALETGDPRVIALATEALESSLRSEAHLERYLATGTSRYIQAFAESTAEAKRAAQQADNGSAQPALVDVIAGGIAALSAYQLAAETVQSATDERRTVQASLDVVGPRIVTDIQELFDTVADYQAAIGRSGMSTSQWMVALLAALSLVAVSFGYLFSRRIARELADGLGARIAEMAGLAEGNLEVAIADRYDAAELQDIGRALQVFRNRSKEAKELEAEKLASEEAVREREARAERERVEEQRKHMEASAAMRKRMLDELQSSVGSVVSAAAEGDFTHRVSADFEEPAMGALARSVNALVERVEEGLSETARVVEGLADGRLDARMEGEYSGLFRGLQAGLNSAVETLRQTVRAIEDQSGSVWVEAGAMTSTSESLARSSEKQASSLEQSSAAMEEFSTSAKQNADHAASVTDRAKAAAARAEAAGEMVGSAVSAMADIKTASDRIGEIVEVMESLAFQTNLLAVNASVESARAGEAGKGFAVVATEVRALAQRSADASRDIKSLVDESTSQVAKGVGLVEKTGEILRETVSDVSGMLDPLADLTQSSHEQATGVEEVTTALAQLDVLTQENASMSQQSRVNAQTLQDNARSMRELIATFQTGSESDATEDGDLSRSA